MKKKILIIGLIFVLLAVGLSGCEEQVKIIGTGEIQYIDLEGGFYGIVSQDTKNYDPVNLPSDFREDGLKVRFELEILEGRVSAHMWGSIVKILKIEKLNTGEDNNATGNLVNYSDCKELFSIRTSTEDCIEYIYDGENVLMLKHINAGFNCCPEIAVNISINNHTIEIEEIEISGVCKCLCLFDINYEIKELNPGNYTIRVIEPFINEDEEILEFQVDLSSKISGSFCVDRYNYPWG
jgi:hypothetical protein